MKIVRIFIFIRVKRKYLSPDTAKIPLQIFLWLDDLVMSAWLQSQLVSWLASCVKPAQIRVAGKYPLAARYCFSVGDYFSWTGFSGLPSYDTDASISWSLPSNSRSGITARSKVLFSVYISVSLIFGYATHFLNWNNCTLIEIIQYTRTMFILDYLFLFSIIQKSQRTWEKLDARMKPLHIADLHSNPLQKHKSQKLSRTKINHQTANNRLIIISLLFISRSRHIILIWTTNKPGPE